MDAFPPRPALVPATPSRFRVGDAEVDVPLRLVTRPGTRRPYRLTPKAIGVLLALVARPGEVVPRHALLATVWPDTLPTDDVLTQAVTQLRKALGEERGNARYIETIAKTGYRLIADVDGGQAAGDEALEAAAPSAAAVGDGRRFHPWAWGLAALCLAAMAALSYRAGWPGAAQEPAAEQRPGPVTLITSRPGYELGPSLSPDALRVAYSATVPGRRGTVLMVQATGHEPPVQISFPPEGVSDQSPAWSPDGRDIAYLRGPVDGCEIRIAAVDGGAERVVGHCDPRDLPSFSWTPDGSGLLFGSMSDAGSAVGIRVLDLASGRWNAVDYPAGPGDLDHVPRHSPDGRWIGFVRNPQLGHLWRIPAGGGPAEQLTQRAGEILGWDWLPDGEALVFSRREGNGTRLYRLDIASRRETWLGIADAQGPDVAASGAIAFERRQSRYGLFRFALADGDSGAAAGGEALFGSSGRDTQPAVAPDGARFAFTSDRSGGFQLWWARLDEPSSLRPVPGFIPAYGSLPEWSPDAGRLLLAGHAEGDAAGDGLYEVAPGSGRMERLPVPSGPAVAGAYLPDPGRLLVVLQEAGPSQRLALFDRSAAPWRELGSIADVSLAKVDAARGRVLFTRLSANGLWQADLGLSPGSVRQLDAFEPARWRFRTWAIGPDGDVLHTRPQSGCLSALRRIGVLDGSGGSQPARCLEDSQLAHPTGFSVTGSHAIVSLGTADDTDIAFVAAPAGY